MSGSGGGPGCVGRRREVHVRGPSAGVQRAALSRERESTWETRASREKEGDKRAERETRAATVTAAHSIATSARRQAAYHDHRPPREIYTSSATTRIRPVRGERLCITQLCIIGLGDKSIDESARKSAKCPVYKERERERRLLPGVLYIPGAHVWRGLYTRVRKHCRAVLTQTHTHSCSEGEKKREEGRRRGGLYTWRANARRSSGRQVGTRARFLLLRASRLRVWQYKCSVRAFLLFAGVYEAGDGLLWIAFCADRVSEALKT